jgi:hypothetical protein
MVRSPHMMDKLPYVLISLGAAMIVIYIIVKVAQKKKK